ncbi:MAG: N-formylglutamate amidohydrolase [Leptospiraceae bacterium]|nr:N-formylglutamate amidohydrolase [Leptospiraceae bacterium]
MRFLLTCEHGSNAIPARYKPLFRNQAAVLNSHRGYDIGAREIWRAFQKKPAGKYSGDLSILQPDLSCMGSTSRLLVDLNRSAHNPALFSEYTRHADRTTKDEILKKYYYTYRNPITEWVQARIAAGHTVLHIAIHSFTPIWQGRRRSTDIGLLYDPARSLEKQWALQWQQALQIALPALCVRRNDPYRGVADGLPTFLRRAAGRAYVGLEVEINQRFYLSDRKTFNQLLKILPATLPLHLLAQIQSR